MAPRKAELLDLMRKQRGAEPATGRSESAPRKSVETQTPQPAAAAPAARETMRPVAGAPAGATAKPSSLPWGGLLLLLLLAIPVVWWLSNTLGSPEVEAGAPNGDGATPATGAPAAAAVEHSVVAIQYSYTPANLERATQVGRDLLQQLGVWGNLVNDQKSWIRIYLGRAESAEDPQLRQLLDRVRQLEYPAGSGKRAFESAYIARLPDTTS